MTEPTARPTAKPMDEMLSRAPKAFAADKAVPEAIPPQDWQDAPDLPALIDPPRRRRNRWWALALWAGGLLVSLALGLAADALIRDLFARYEWLGWLGTALTVLFVIALIALIIGEILALRRLGNLDHLRSRAASINEGGSRDEGRQLVNELQVLYHTRPDMAAPRQNLDRALQNQFDGAEMVQSAERSLMTPLDARARAFTSAAARRVALVTAVSPRALVDLVFVAYESLKLARAIARLYGSRPGFFSSWKLAGAVLSHLAVTGGVALGDSVIQQLLGHGLAARLSARLGEGLVNGLMTARVGIAAMAVTRPLPYAVTRRPQVMDFAVDLGKIARGRAEDGPKAD